jgi:hypothetical protein
MEHCCCHMCIYDTIVIDDTKHLFLLHPCTIANKHTSNGGVILSQHHDVEVGHYQNQTLIVFAMLTAYS